MATDSSANAAADSTPADSGPHAGPRSDTDGKAWQLTTSGADFTDEKMSAQQPAVVECYLWVDGYPVQQGDVLCDPAAPSKRAWICLDPLLCKDKPDLEVAESLALVWSLATEGSRTDASGAVTIGKLLPFKEMAAPEEEGAPIQCSDWDDRKGSADLGDALTWCDRGRVFRCVEEPVVVTLPAITVGIKGATQTAPAVTVSTRPCCSGPDRPAVGAKRGCWRQARQRGIVATKSAAEPAIATIATFAAALSAAAQMPHAQPTEEHVKAMLGSKCTRGTDEEVEKMFGDADEMAVKIKTCDPEKIDDIMCPKKADGEVLLAEMAAKEKGTMTAEDEKKMKEVKDMMKKGIKCFMQCMICDNFPDSLSGASTILMGATVAFIGAVLF